MLRPRTILAASALVAVAVAAPAHGQNLLANSGFETPAIVAPSTFALYGAGTLIGSGGAGWTALGSGVAVLHDSYFEGNGVNDWSARSGAQFLDLTGAGSGTSSAGVSQSIATTIGATYRLRFHVGRALSATNESFYASNAVVDLAIDGGPRASFVNGLTTPVGGTAWLLFTQDIVAASAQTTLAFYNGSAGNSFVGLDDVSFEALPAQTPVPEPGTWALLASGLVALGGVARRGRRATTT